jgi:hypothetical protein
MRSVAGAEMGRSALRYWANVSTARPLMARLLPDRSTPKPLPPSARKLLTVLR